MSNIGVNFDGGSINMNFLNGEINVPKNYGGYVIASGCGSGKTTVIKDIIRQKFNEGILYSAATIREVDEMYEWIMNNIIGSRVDTSNGSYVLTEDEVVVLHSKNEDSKFIYRFNPEEITKKMIVLCTHYKLFHDDPNILITQNFDIRKYNRSISLIRNSLTMRMPQGTEYMLPRQWILIDEMPSCDQLKAYFTKSTKMSLLETVNNSVKHTSEDGLIICDKVEMRLKGYDSYLETEMAYEMKVKGTREDPFPESANSNNEFKMSVPAKLRKDLLLSNFYENEASKINTSDFGTIRDGYIKYNISDFIVDNMMTRVLIFDGTGDLTFGFDNRKFNLKNIPDKYNSKCIISKIDSNIARKFKESYILNHEKNVYDDLDRCCNQLVDIINENEKTLIVTWKNLKMISQSLSGRAKSSLIKLINSNSEYNKEFSLPEYITDRLRFMGVSKEFSIIHYGSGLDKATNEFRDYDSIVFLGEFHVPQEVIEEFNSTYSAKSNMFRYTLYQLVQAICRTRIRNHKGESVNVYMTDDWDNKYAIALNLYLNYNRYNELELLSSNNIKLELDNAGPNVIDSRNILTKLSNKWRPVVEKLDSELFPGLLRDMNQGIPRKISVKLDDIYNVIPMAYKEVARYYSLINYLRKFMIELEIIGRI